MNDSYFPDTKEGIDLSVYHCGIEQCQPGHSYGPAVRDHFLIHYILDGCGRFFIDGNEYHLHKNQGFLICPNIVTYYEADSQNPWTYTWVGFNGVKAEQYLKYAGLDRFDPIFTYDKGSFVAQCFSRMMDARQLKRGDTVRLQGLLYIFLSELIESGEPKVSNSKSPTDLYIRKAMQYIQANYSQHMSINELAAYIGLNRSYFSALFKQYIHLSPQEFIIRFRMDKACELMSNAELSISDISRSVGYDDPLSFSKIFKKIKGVSPYQYRKGFMTKS